MSCWCISFISELQDPGQRPLAGLCLGGGSARSMQKTELLSVSLLLLNSSAEKLNGASRYAYS